MSDVLAMAGVGVVRGDTVILEDVSWDVEEGQRWVVLGPNGAGKTTLLQLASARIHPTTGVVGILGEVLGAVDVFELRPRIGLASASLAERIPAGERVRDVVVTASYGVVGRWREQYDRLDEGRADEPARGAGRRPPRRPALRHAVGGGAQAGADRPRAHDRPRADAPRRAGRRPRPRRARGPRPPPRRARGRPRRRRPWSS